MEMLVREISDTAAGVRTFRLRPKDAAAVLPPHQPGSHVDVTGPTGLTTQYSLCGDPGSGQELLIAVKRTSGPRGASAALFDQVAEGSTLHVGEPRSILSIHEEAKHHLLVAAGIGVTPILSLAYGLKASGHSFQVCYVARSEQEAPLLPEIRAAVDKKDLFVLTGLSREEQADRLKTLIHQQSPGTAVYACGPAGFMERVEQWTTEQLGAQWYLAEFFEADAATTAPEGERAFLVELDGATFEVPPDRSILSVLEQGGADLAMSCREGVCGSCVMQVLEGSPDHRDNCLSNAEKAAGDQIAVCVSRAFSDKLVLDY